LNGDTTLLKKKVKLERKINDKKNLKSRINFVVAISDGIRERFHVFSL